MVATTNAQLVCPEGKDSGFSLLLNWSSGRRRPNIFLLDQMVNADNVKAEVNNLPVFFRSDNMSHHH